MVWVKLWYWHFENLTSSKLSPVCYSFYAFHSSDLFIAVNGQVIVMLLSWIVILKNDGLILNKRFQKNAKHFFYFLTVLVELKAVGSWSSGGWLNVELTPSASPSSCSPSSSVCWFSGSTVIPFCLENTLRFCCRFIMKRKHKNKVNNRSLNRSVKYAKRWSRLQSLFELLGTPDTKCTHTPVVSNASHFARSFQASKHTYLF